MFRLGVGALSQVGPSALRWSWITSPQCQTKKAVRSLRDTDLLIFYLWSIETFTAPTWGKTHLNKYRQTDGEKVQWCHTDTCWSCFSLSASDSPSASADVWLVPVTDALSSDPNIPGESEDRKWRPTTSVTSSQSFRNCDTLGSRRADTVFCSLLHSVWRKQINISPHWCISVLLRVS